MLNVITPDGLCRVVTNNKNVIYINFKAKLFVALNKASVHNSDAFGFKMVVNNTFYHQFGISMHKRSVDKESFNQRGGK